MSDGAEVCNRGEAEKGSRSLFSCRQQHRLPLLYYKRISATIRSRNTTTTPKTAVAHKQTSITVPTGMKAIKAPHKAYHVRIYVTGLCGDIDTTKYIETT